MSSSSERLTDADSAGLTERVERFRAAWAPDGSTDLSDSLPPHGAPHRRAVLIGIIRADMERRAAARLPFRVERYVGMFPDDLTSDSVPAELLTAEYRLRHKFTDRPPLSDYERWFPDQFPAIEEALRRDPLERSSRSVRPDEASSPGLNATMPQTVRPVQPPPGDVLPSDTPYYLVRKLGSGAFGEVFEAHAPGGVRVAVKRILHDVRNASSLAEQDALERIKNLSHPFLLKTQAYWVFADRLVIVMDLADGSLADRIDYHKAQGRPGVPPEELIPLFEQAGDALDYLHSKSVSHRDIKPENILIRNGYAAVADFGLVRIHAHTMTNVGQTAGTPAYMAPEMWQQKVSLHSDQYSLAATYVRARLGRHLFETNILIDLANSHVNGTPDLAALPEAEQRVLLKALAKNPDGRFPSCKEFATALRTAVFPPPEPPKPPPAPEPVRERGQPNPLVMALTIGVTVAVAVAVAVAVVILVLRPPAAPTSPTPPVQAEPPKPDPKQLPTVKFDGWTAEGEPKTIGEKRYPPRFMRKVSDDVLVALLVHPTGNPDDPQPFYILKDKVTIRVFKNVWGELDKDTDSELYKISAEDGKAALIRDVWPALAKDRDPNAPVLGATLTESLLVARRLGGALPSFDQWRKATGNMEPRAPEWPPKNGSTLESAKDANDRKLALKQDSPLPITEGDGDVSVWGVRQLLTNGREWTGYSKDSPTRIPLVPDMLVQAVFTGEDFGSGVVMSSAACRTPSRSAQLNTVEPAIGFRIVLEPR